MNKNPIFRWEWEFYAFTIWVSYLTLVRFALLFLTSLHVLKVSVLNSAMLNTSMQSVKLRGLEMIYLTVDY